MKRCFLDIDGVMADWTAGMHRALHVDYDPRCWPYNLGPNGWNWHDEIGYTFNAVSELCTFKFWEDLNWTFDGHDILRTVLEFYDPDEITLLTTPMPNVMSASGKIAWVRKNLPEYERRMLICPGKKSILANTPNSVLVDDGWCNVQDWRAAGGRATLVPRWWNTLHQHAMDAVSLVSQSLYAHMLTEA